SEEAAEAEAVEEGETSGSRVRKRKIARAKKPRAIIKRNAMNQLRCQIGRSESEWIEDSLYMIRVDPDCCCGCWEEEEEGFLRESPWCEPEEATVGL
ncbi:hypothetical protein A2U01_0053652, partial [Trifolium medium]|nr:hypothetical protein [Trifolium medium]